MPKRALSGGHAAMTLLRDTLIILRGLGASAARPVPAVYLTAPVGRAAVTGRAATHSTADHPAACHATANHPAAGHATTGHPAAHSAGRSTAHTPN